jgi:hypothetical protein
MSEHDEGPVEWVEAASCRWIHEAQMLKSVLEAAGIEAIVPDEHTLAVNPLYAPLIGWPRVLVHPGDLDRAREVIASAAGPIDEADVDDDEGEVTG